MITVYLRNGGTLELPGATRMDRQTFIGGSEPSVRFGDAQNRTVAEFKESELAGYVADVATTRRQVEEAVGAQHQTADQAPPAPAPAAPAAPASAAPASAAPASAQSSPQQSEAANQPGGELTGYERAREG